MEALPTGDEPLQPRLIELGYLTLLRIIAGDPAERACTGLSPRHIRGGHGDRKIRDRYGLGC
jgi:hypothetical protein